MKLREKTWSLLCKVCIDRKYANLLLRNDLKTISTLDRSLITQILYGTLQNYRLVRYDWEDLVTRMPSDEVCLLLDMSVYQLLYMDKLPDYAVVNDAVDIAKRKMRGYEKLVNALLHKVISRGKREIVGNPQEVNAIAYSLPLWLVKMWSAQYGQEVCEQLCKDNITISNTWVRLDERAISSEEFIQEYPDFERSEIASDCLIFKGHQLVDSIPYQSGLISIQDASSQMVTDLLDPQQGERILDCCAAPGSKSCHIATRMNNQGELIAGDIHEHRVQLISSGAQRCHLDIIKPMCFDATTLDETFELESFDRVLVDVPCSGYGVLKGKSDIKYHMQSSDMDTLIPLQKKILDQGAKMVKKDGILLYSTCTLNKKENEKQVEQFLKDHPQFELVEEKTVLPYTFGSDGFYMAKLLHHIKA